MRAFVGLLALPALFLSPQARAQPGESLIGVWRAVVDHGPKLHGRLVIRKSRIGYLASVGGQRALGTGSDDLRFAFGPDGSFRGRVEGHSITGFWIQPSRATEGGGDAGGASQSFATPMRLAEIGRGAWSGTIEPVRDRFTLWLSIFKDTDQTLTAAFRNPERNSTGGASRFQVLVAGNSIRFSAKRDQSTIVHDAQLLGNPDRILVDWKDVGSTLELERVSAVGAATFYPRAPGSAAYVYRRPPELADGWKTANASSTGLDEQLLQSIVRAIAQSDPTARPPQLIHSLLVAHKGKLVLDEYFYGFDRTTPHDLRSAGKTFASVLLGTAPARSAGLSPQSRIYDLMRSLGPFPNPDPRKSEITLANLMTHTSGLACNDNDDTSPGNEETMQGQTAEPNWWRYTLDLPQLFRPGVRYAYCSANMNLVGGALTRATGTWLPELFRRTLADPLQFGEWHWNLMANGEGYLGGGAFLLPRDFLKIGQMYLDGGVWNGRRIVPAGWVRESTRPHVEINPETTGLSDDEFGNFYLRAEDGLAWHLNILKARGRTYRTYGATGNGGQLLIVVPEADLAVVFTGGNFSQGGVWLRWAQQIVGDKIIPAIRQP